jgi:hypothetical protein
MAIEPPKRNDLPVRAAKRIMESLFPFEYRADDPKYNEHASTMTKVFRHHLESEITRAIWQEMVAIEGERALGETR